MTPKADEPIVLRLVFFAICLEALARYLITFDNALNGFLNLNPIVIFIYTPYRMSWYIFLSGT